MYWCIIADGPTVEDRWFCVDSATVRFGCGKVFCVKSLSILVVYKPFFPFQCEWIISTAPDVSGSYGTDDDSPTSDVSNTLFWHFAIICETQGEHKIWHDYIYFQNNYILERQCCVSISAIVPIYTGMMI